jgi:hypothetical protein
MLLYVYTLRLSCDAFMTVTRNKDHGVRACCDSKSEVFFTFLEIIVPHINSLASNTTKTVARHYLATRGVRASSV